MIRRSAVLLASLFLGLAVLASAPAPLKPASARVVYLGGGLGYEERVVFTSCLAASEKPGVVLLDTPQTRQPNQEFLKAYQAERVVPVGSFPDGVAGLEKRLGMKGSPPLEWKRGPPLALWQEVFPQAERVVVSPVEPRRVFLQAACLAGVLNAPLYPTRGAPNEEVELRRRLTDWGTREIFAIASASRVCDAIPHVTVVPLADETSVVSAYRKEQLKKGPINALVVANPADATRDGMSALAPWLALQRRALLLLTNDAGDNCAELVQEALQRTAPVTPEFLILAASLTALPMEKRPNPLPGKDSAIDMEPLTPTGLMPFTFATGRLFHEEPAMVALMLARQRLLEQTARPRKALVVSNPGKGLPLLETFSRHTCNELRNAGYQTTALFGDDVSRARVRRLLPEHDIFLWEGHYKTLVEDYQFLTWTEPLPPSLIFLQSCLALKEDEVHPLVPRGAVAIVGTSTRTYSATGGAFTLAFFDALLYDELPLGGALRQAKNFLLAYALLKQKRLNDQARLAGVNLRSAWAFTLWGDPTLTLPRPETPDNALPGVRHEVQERTLVLHLPEQAYETVVVGSYEAKMRPNARLAGLLNSAPEGHDRRSLVPFVFVEVKLARVPPGKVPQLSGRVPEKDWVFLWDKQRSRGYLLLTPRSKSQHELRFKITWKESGDE